MKKMRLVFTLMVCLTLLCCSSNDDSGKSTTVTGTLVVNGVSYKLTKGFIVPPSDGSNPDSDPRRFYLVLTNGEVSYVNNSTLAYSDSITQLIDFNMYTSVAGSGSVESTTYPIYDFNNPNFDWDGAFIDHSGVNTNVLIQNGSYVSSDRLSSDDMEGSATVSVNNGIYTITFSYFNDGNTVSGNFTGPLSEL